MPAPSSVQPLVLTRCIPAMVTGGQGFSVSVWLQSVLTLLLANLKRSQASPSRLLPDCPSSRRMAPLPFFFRSPCRRIVVTARLGSRSHLCVLESSSFRVSEGEHGNASALSACGTVQRELYSFVIVMARFDLSAPPSLGLHLQAGLEAVGNERSCRYIHSGTCIWQLQYRHLHTFQACRAPQRRSLRLRCRRCRLPVSVCQASSMYATVSHDREA